MNGGLSEEWTRGRATVNDIELYSVEADEHTTEGALIWVERPQTSHWVQNDASERVNALLLAFLAEQA